MTMQARQKRMLHRARYRGFKEADILVGGFAEQALPGMSAAELDAFEEILDCADHDIYGWVCAAIEPPAGIDPGLIARMRAFDAAEKIRQS